MQFFSEPMAIIWCAAALVATFLFGWGVGRRSSYVKGIIDGGEILLTILSRVGAKVEDEETDV